MLDWERRLRKMLIKSGDTAGRDRRAK
uniref:Uncharacterized protein n=1 Tax=Timema cristinae TaxID=61476 RepID=A0A7R9HH27_TIMCR|nr:unnamed protein product [Timema cristinae]